MNLPLVFCLTFSLVFQALFKVKKKQILIVLFVLFGLACKITIPLRYSYLSSLQQDNADIFEASLLKSYCIFSLVTLSAIVKIIFLPVYLFSYIRNIHNKVVYRV